MQTDIQKIIFKIIEKQGEFTINDIRRKTGISRQAIHKKLKKLLEAGKLQKIGSTRGAKYVLPGKSADITHTIRRSYPIEGLEEDDVLQSIQLGLNLRSTINSNAQQIFSYSFTEVLNNAIDHSQSDRVYIDVELKKYDIVFTIRDYGVGIYYHMKNRLGLPAEETSVRELIKGKATTDPERHTGEGLFFTARSADALKISSHYLALMFDNKIRDIFTETIRYRKGTGVDFSISRNTKRKLADSFDEYAGEEYDYIFSKTSVRVKLYAHDGDRFISRSIAKRILHRLDQFKEIVIDFTDVRLIGQGFADQIFRVFQKQHPHIKITPVNTSVAIRTMIAHVTSDFS
jgi:biotin operon repressor